MAEPLATVDQMIEFSVAELASGDGRRIGALVRSLANRWPDDKALLIAFALTSAAGLTADFLRSGPGDGSPERAYKLAALVAADVLAVESLGQSPVRGRHLLQFWRRVDPYFLNL